MVITQCNNFFILMVEGKVLVHGLPPFRQNHQEFLYFHKHIVTVVWLAQLPCKESVSRVLLYFTFGVVVIDCTKNENAAIISTAGTYPQNPLLLCNSFANLSG